MPFTNDMLFVYSTGTEALFVQAGGKACTYHPNPMPGSTDASVRGLQILARGAPNSVLCCQ